MLRVLRGTVEAENMTPTINVNDEVYRELGRFGNRDESWNTVVNRILKHVDEEAAMEDRDNREDSGDHESTSLNFDDIQADSETVGDPHLRQLEDSTPVRHRYRRGNYSGAKIMGRIENGQIQVAGRRFPAPSRAAVAADKEKRGEDARESINGWRWWEYQKSDGEWVKLDSLRD
jgi:predicted CopG family antitoxin